MEKPPNGVICGQKINVEESFTRIIRHGVVPHNVQVRLARSREGHPTEKQELNRKLNRAMNPSRGCSNRFHGVSKTTPLVAPCKHWHKRPAPRRKLMPDTLVKTDGAQGESSSQSSPFSRSTKTKFAKPFSTARRSTDRQHSEKNKKPKHEKYFGF